MYLKIFLLCRIVYDSGAKCGNDSLTLEKVTENNPCSTGGFSLAHVSWSGTLTVTHREESSQRRAASPLAGRGAGVPAASWRGRRTALTDAALPPHLGAVTSPRDAARRDAPEQAPSLTRNRPRRAVPYRAEPAESQNAAFLLTYKESIQITSRNLRQVLNCVMKKIGYLIEFFCWP